MKKMIPWAILAVIALVAFYGFQKYRSFIGQEVAIEAAYDANKAVLDQVAQTISGTGLAADKYAAVAIEAIKAGMSGRYGPAGSQAAMQWIKEAQPAIDPAAYTKLQQVIEAQFAAWKSAQISLRDRVRVYDADIQVPPGSLVASIFGFPRQSFDMAKYKTMIVTQSTSNAFQTGRMQGVGDMLGKPPQ